MATIEMVMPKMGESIIEGTILSWLKKEGDVIEQDESVLEVATDKVDTEVPATHGGILKKILAKEGEVIPVGQAIAIIETEAGDAAPISSKQEDKVEVVSIAPAHTSTIVSAVTAGISNSSIEDGRFYSPLVLSIAKEEKLSKEELAKIPGSGKDARVTKNDVLSYLKSRSIAPTQEMKESSTFSAPKIEIQVSGEDEILEMDRMRKMIAQRMVDSKRISPHVTSFVEADVTNIVYMEKQSKRCLQKERRRSFDLHPIFYPCGCKGY
jgi:2-oxoglutarate dehydrogenase E2 component (dihydrolipoamide succinyltransferase)